MPPNALIANSKPLQDFDVHNEIVERASGLEFAAKVPPQRRKKLRTEGVILVAVLRGRRLVLCSQFCLHTFAIGRSTDEDVFDRYKRRRRCPGG